MILKCANQRNFKFNANFINMILNIHRRFVSQILKNVRYKHRENHWSVQRKKKTGPIKALEHFDDFYKQVYGKLWHSIREGLLGPRKYICILNNYSDIENSVNKLENSGALNIRKLFELEKSYESENKLQRLRKASLNRIYSMEEEINSKLDLNKDKLSEHQTKKTTAIKTLKHDLDNAEIDISRMVDLNISESSANLHEFIPATQIKGKENFVLESTHYSYYQQSHDYPLKLIPESDIHFPNALQAYYLPDGEQTFPPPKSGDTGVLDYYLLDGASLLPILALDLKPGCTLLDLCAAPGGKSLMAVQTLYPEMIVSNDISKSRSERIYRVFNEYLYDLNEKWLDTEKLRLTIHDGRFLRDYGYDRVLVDVPCTTDRHSLFEEDNNIFRSSRIKERLQLPELQRDLLVNALKLVKPNGIVVYSTCSLSPIQNDGVVHMALKKLWMDDKIEVAIIDLNLALRQVKSVFSITKPNFCKYGNVVLPDVCNNFGPMYFCKLKRLK